MVVEDDPVHSRSMRAMLKKAGFSVCTASGGPPCLQAASRLGPDLILVDSLTPDGGCVEICSRLKKSPDIRDIPVIFLTASTDELTLQKTLDAGASEFIRKPVSRTELLARIRSVLKQQQTMRQLVEEENLRNVLETAAAVCHELNQPLQYVMGAIQLILMDLPPEDPNFEPLDAIRSRAEQMGAITRKLAELTSCRSGTHTEGVKLAEKNDLTKGS